MSQLRKKTMSALLWDAGGMLVKQGGTFVTTIFLARILDPSDFGLIGMTIVFIGFAEVLVDAGFGNALIQRQDNTSQTYASVFFFNIVIAIAIVLSIFLSAPLIGEFYNNVDVIDILRWLTLVVFFNSMNVVQVAILRKNLEFKKIAFCTSLSGIVGGIIGVLAALSDLGVYSLVLQHITQSIIRGVLFWSVSKWRPSFIFLLIEIKKLSSFSLYVFLDKLTSEISMRMDVMIIGRIFSPALLGYYTRALSLKDMVTSYTSTSIARVVYPLLSSLQDDSDRFRGVYFKIYGSLVFLSYWISASLFILGQDIIIILFGLKWEPSVELFQLLALASINTPANILIVNATLGLGNSQGNFKVGLLRKALRIVPVVMAFFYGLKVFLFSLITMNYLVSLINILFISRQTKVSIATHLRLLAEQIIPISALVIAYLFFELDSATTLVRGLVFIGFTLLYLGYNLVISNIAIKYLYGILQKLFLKLKKR